MAIFLEERTAAGGRGYTSFSSDCIASSNFDSTLLSLIDLSQSWKTQIRAAKKVAAKLAIFQRGTGEGRQPPRFSQYHRRIVAVIGGMKIITGMSGVPDSMEVCCMTMACCWKWYAL